MRRQTYDYDDSKKGSGNRRVKRGYGGIGFCAGHRLGGGEKKDVSSCGGSAGDA